MKKGSRIAALLLSAVLGLGSCAPDSTLDAGTKESISFSWWGKDNRHSYTISAVKQFVNLNPDIEVIQEYNEFDVFQKKMDVVFAAHDECDVMQINYDWLYRYSPDGEGFYDLKKLSQYIDFSNFTEEQLSYGMINGKLNGIPNALNTQICYYDKDMYDRYGLELPKDWDDLFEAAGVMKQDRIYPLQMNRKAAWMMCIAYEEQKTGRRCFDDTGRMCFGRAEFADLLTFYKRLVDEKVTKFLEDVQSQDLNNAAAAGMVCWISDADNNCSAAIEAGRNIVVGDFLRMEGSSISGWYAKPTSLYGIRRDTDEPRAAALLVNFLLNSEEMAQQQGTEKGIPLSRAMLEALESGDRLKGIQFTANEKMMSSPEVTRISPLLENNELVTAFVAAAHSVLDGSKDVNDAAEELRAAAAAV
ncbi:MAG: carbohydrate ABC transporter substrate-binding protein [Ruminococcus sp.]|nr:carbohydrate ABC transporter substrate-binding protein [Ruminococcus sp.]